MKNNGKEISFLDTTTNPTCPFILLLKISRIINMKVTNTALSAEPLLFDREAKSVKQYLLEEERTKGVGEWSKPSSLF